MCGLEHARYCFPDPLVTDDEGLELLPYEPGLDETCIGPDGKEVSIASRARASSARNSIEPLKLMSSIQVKSRTLLRV